MIANIKKIIKKNINSAIPLHVREKMYPSNRQKNIILKESYKLKKSAVLICLYPYKNSIYTCFIQRGIYEGRHSGQISLPGGTFDKRLDGDSLRTTALREAYEEVGIKPAEVDILGCLKDFIIPVSNFKVSPFIGICSYRPDFVVDPKEVVEIIEVPISLFNNKSVQKEKFEYYEGERILIPYYDMGKNKHLWGATAVIMTEFNQIITTNI